MEDPLFRILFFKDYECYLKDYRQYDTFKLKGINIEHLENKIGTFCFKILSNLDTIISYADNLQEKIYNADNNSEDILHLVHDFCNSLNTIDELLSKLTLSELLSKLGNRTLKIKEIETQINIAEQKMKDFPNDDTYLLLYNDLKKDLKNLKSNKYDKFVLSIIDEYIYTINNARLFINYYFNLISNNEVKKNLKQKSPNVRAYSIQAICDFTLTLPKSEKILCVLDGKDLIPTTSYLFHNINKSKSSKEEKEKNFLEYENLLYQGKMNNDTIYFSDIYNINTISDLLNISINYFIQNNITVSKCKNCRKYFIPANKSNETLCNNIYKNRKKL